MNEEKKSASGKVVGGIIFLVGFILMLVVGWVVFPKILYSQKAQPMNFSHAAHQDSTCEDCHAFKPDGTYSGIPAIDKCKECHESQIGSSQDEKVLVEEYVQQNKEIPWKVYAWQPDNVFFSHAAHKAKGVECVKCHRDVSKEATLPPYREDIITGYSLGTMDMVDCEKCHAERGVTNNCEICHK